MSLFRCAFLAMLAVVSVHARAPAQDPAIAVGADDLRIPIHTNQPSPDGTPYGWWAAGPGFKCSFHDGFAFFPALGPDAPASLPLRWRTVSVRAGGVELVRAGAAPLHHRGDWRYEYRHAGLVEAYDVLVDGVEQTFTIHQRPARAGPIVVRGEVSTTLEAAPVAEQHESLAFVDANGTERVRYGAAWAIDARGRRTDVQTSFDGRHVELSVAAAFVGDAVFPLVIDPLTSPVVTSTWGGATWGLPVDSAIGRESESATANVMIAHARQFSATDYDLYVGIHRDDLSRIDWVYIHLAANLSARWPSIAPVGGADRWVLVFEVSNGTTAWVDAYFHAFGNTMFRSGTAINVADGRFGPSRRPRVGGQRSWTAGAKALCVFQFDLGSSLANTPHTEVYGRLVDAATMVTVGPNIYLGGGPVGPRVDRELPCINQESGGGDTSWIVGWQEIDRSTPGALWNFVLNRVSPARLDLPANMGCDTTFDNEIDVRVAGRDGRYLVSFLNARSSSVYGYNVCVRRVDWPETAARPTVTRSQSVELGDDTALFFNGDLAYDTTTRSHWAVVYGRGGGNVAASKVFAARVGYTGGVVERNTVYAQPTTGAFSPSVTFDQAARSFVLTYCVNDLAAQLPVYARRMTYSPDAVAISYGTGCRGAIACTEPYAGHEFFTVRLAAGAPNANQLAALWVGTAPTATSLRSYGMPGCFLNTSPVVSIGASTGASGDAALTFRLPDGPTGFYGDLYLQWVFAAPAVPWPLALATTAGLKVQVR